MPTFFSILLVVPNVRQIGFNPKKKNTLAVVLLCAATADKLAFSLLGTTSAV